MFYFLFHFYSIQSLYLTLLHVRLLRVFNKCSILNTRFNARLGRRWWLKVREQEMQNWELGSFLEELIFYGQLRRVIQPRLLGDRRRRGQLMRLR